MYKPLLGYMLRPLCYRLHVSSPALQLLQKRSAIRVESTQLTCVSRWSCHPTCTADGAARHRNSHTIYGTSIIIAYS
eukprot:1195894-Prorocentrum_minimum.AAC.3